MLPRLPYVACELRPCLTEPSSWLRIVRNQESENLDISLKGTEVTGQTSKHESLNTHHVLRSSLELPCGAVLKNRLAKSAMSDSLGNGGGDPTEVQARLYERWAQGGVAVSVIGEVQGDPRFPEKPGNLVFGEQSDQQAIQALVSQAVINGTHLWP